MELGIFPILVGCVGERQGHAGIVSHGTHHLGLTRGSLLVLCEISRGSMLFLEALGLQPLIGLLPRSRSNTVYIHTYGATAVPWRPYPLLGL